MGISKEMMYKSLWLTIKLAPIGVVAFVATPIIVPVVKLVWAWLPLSISIYRATAWLPSLNAIKYGAGAVFALFRVKALLT